MPDIVVRWITLIGVAIALIGVGFVKGCNYGKSEAEKEKAAAIAVAAEEKARIATEHAQALSKYQEKEKTDEKARTDLAAANLGLRNAIAGYRRNTPFTVASDPVCPANNLLELCGRAYQEVALRGGERVAECAKEFGLMAGAAETERGKAELSNSLYESISSRVKRMKP